MSLNITYLHRHQITPPPSAQVQVKIYAPAIAPEPPPKVQIGHKPASRVGRGIRSASPQSYRKSLIVQDGCRVMRSPSSLTRTPTQPSVNGRTTTAITGVHHSPQSSRSITHRAAVPRWSMYRILEQVQRDHHRSRLYYPQPKPRPDQRALHHYRAH